MNREVKVVVAYTHNVSSPGILVERLPKPGETVRAIGHSEGIDGAKGTNVAVTCSKQHVPTALVAHVKGGDWYSNAKKVLADNNIDDKYIVKDADEKPAGGCVIIDTKGQNMIVLSAKNIQAISKQQIDEALDNYPEAKYLVTGYELENKSVHDVLLSAKEHGIKTILNPSPVPDTMPKDWGLVDILVLNEVETEHMLILAGKKYTDNQSAINYLREDYHCKDVIITLGEKGFFCSEGNEFSSHDGYKVEAIDTTGAGDGFLGSVAAKLAGGSSIYDACEWANKFSSLTVQRLGTISSYLETSEVEGFLEKAGII